MSTAPTVLESSLQATSTSRRERQRRWHHNMTLPLSLLPAELRNLIWDFTIPTHQTLIAIPPSDRRYLSPERHAAARKYACERHRAREAWPAMAPSVRGSSARYLTDLNAWLEGKVAATPVITQVCKALREETLRIFYGSNVFKLRTNAHMEFTEMKKWLGDRPQIGLQAMRRIEVHYTLGGNHQLGRFFSFRLRLDLVTGSVESESRPPVSAPLQPVPLASFRHLPLISQNTRWRDWAKDAIAWEKSIRRVAISVPLAKLDKQAKSASRRHGFGVEGTKRSCKQLMKIIKTFRVYNGVWVGPDPQCSWKTHVARFLVDKKRLCESYTRCLRRHWRRR